MMQWQGSSSLHSKLLLQSAMRLSRSCGCPADDRLLPDSNQASLAVQGCMSEAWTYLSLLPGEASPSTAELRDRVFRSYRAELSAQPPPFPFVAEDVQAAPQGESFPWSCAAGH